MIEPFVAKPFMVMHHHEPECHVKRLFCYLQGQGHSEGSYNPNITIPHIVVISTSDCGSEGPGFESH